MFEQYTDECYLALGIPEKATVCSLCWTPEFFAGIAVPVNKEAVALNTIIEGPRAKKARI